MRAVTRSPLAGALAVVLLAIGWAPARAHAQQAAGQVGLGSCSDPWGTPVRGSAALRQLHPEALRARFAPSITQRDWATALAGYAAVIDSTLVRDLAGGSAPFDSLRRELRSAMQRFTNGMMAPLRGPVSGYAEALSRLEMNQFGPTLLAANNQLVILQSDAGRPFGLAIDSTRLSKDELKAICWSAWSLYRLAQNVNFETIPAALVRLEAQARRWERYRTRGPMQLPHELVANRLLRAAFPARGAHRYNPPRAEFVLAHPFGGLELARVDGDVQRTESLALETGGITVWVNDWQQHVGISWVLAYDADGRIGRGPLVRLGGYATAGVLRRRDATGTQRTSLLLAVDALRLLKPDAAPQAARQAQSLAGEILSSR